MKKYIIAPLCSAIIIPGFGQVLNGQIKKGLIHMGVVFVIFIAGVIKLIPVLMDILQGLGPDELNIKGIQTGVDEARADLMDISILRVIMIVLLIIWIYSIIDAFITGIRIEKERKQS